MQALRAQGTSRDSLVFQVQMQPYLSIYGFFVSELILLTNRLTIFIVWGTSDFFVAYISLISFIVLYLGHKVVFRTRLVSLADIYLKCDRAGREK